MTDQADPMILRPDPDWKKKLGTPLTPRQIGEFEARAFLGDETWKQYKTHYDWCMGYRKTIKGKPTDEQREILEENASWIEFYGSVLFHSTSLAKRNLCACTRCGQKRTGK